MSTHDGPPPTRLTSAGILPNIVSHYMLGEQLRYSGIVKYNLRCHYCLNFNVILVSLFFCQVPALQTILLFSRSLDTSSDCTRIIADEWIEVTIPDNAGSQNIIASTLQLRNAWEQLLRQRLEANNKGNQGRS